MKLDLVRSEISTGQLDVIDLQEIEADPERLPALCPPGAILIVDEVWRIFPAGRKVDKIPDAYKSFFAEHRHRVNAKGESTNIVLVTQDLAQIAAFARQLIETTYRTTKLTTVGLSKRFRTDVYHGPVSGPNPPVGQALRQIFGKYEPKIYRYYSSHTQSESAKEGANEASTDKRANVLRTPLALIIPVVLLVLTVFGVWGLRHGTHKLEGGGKAKTVDGLTSLAPGGMPGTRAAAPVEDWHLTARLDGLCWQGGCGWALLERGDESQWVPLGDCHATGPNWTCRTPGSAGTAPGILPAAGRRPDGGKTLVRVSGRSVGGPVGSHSGSVAPLVSGR
jgi:zona occludens toxin (predicted ATPase)